jgi:hypothetical protein
MTSVLELTSLNNEDGMKRFCVLLLLLLPVIVFAGNVTLVSETPNELVVDFKMPEWSLDTLQGQGQIWQRIICDEGSYTSEEGYPELKVFAEAIGIPVDGDISYQVISSKQYLVQNVNLNPVKKMVVQDWEVDYIYARDNKIYSSNTLYPTYLINKGESAFIGDRNFISLEIYPFQYKPRERVLQVTSELRIRVIIHGTKSQTKDWQLSQNIIDRGSNSFLINNLTSKEWRLPKVKDNAYQTPKSSSNLYDELQIVVDTDGIYKISYDDINDCINAIQDSMGIDFGWSMSNVDPRYLELSDKNGPVAINFIGESDGHFDTQDRIEFYGVRNPGVTSYYGSYTSENVYTLKLNSTLGARMAVENGGLIISDNTKYIVPDAYQETVRLEQQLVTDKLGHSWTSSNPLFFREDQWFWKKISAPNLEIVPFNLQYPIDSTIRTFNLKMSLYGLTYNDTLTAGLYDHSATVRLNQAMINTHKWVGQTERIFNNPSPIPNSFLRHGTNNLYISLSGETTMADREQILFDYAELNYWRQYKTDTDYIKFSRPLNRPYFLYQFSLQGFSSGDVSVYKIGSSVFNNMQVEAFNLDGVAPWTVTFQDSIASNSVWYVAVTEAQKLKAKSIRVNFNSDLKNPNNYGDVLLITRRDFIDCEGTLILKQQWEAQGRVVNIVDVQDIYDEFNYGIREAKPIKDFIQYAYNNWGSPHITHVLLVGEGTDDERDFTNNKIYNVIPVKKVWTFKHGATASDSWYSCIVGKDVVPDIAIARINVWKPEQILDYANKVVSYNSNHLTSSLWNSHITYTSGGKITDPEDTFSQQSERIRRKSIPDYYRVSRVYTSTQTVSTDYFGGTFALKDAINTGTKYVQFMGHGGGRIWADYNLFNFNDVATLNNQAFPVFVSLACYASAFDTPGISSISEALVMQPNKGAIGAIGFTGLGYLNEDEDYGLAMNEALFKNNLGSVGEAFIYATARFYTVSSSTSARYALTQAGSYLGDPLIRFNEPLPGVKVTLNKYIFQPGDTLKVTAQFPAGVNAAKLFIMKTNEKIVNVPYDLPVLQNTYQASYVIPISQGTNYLRTVYVGGYSSDNEYIGKTQISVGRSNVMHALLTPETPAWSDSVSFAARIFAQSGVTSVKCIAQTGVNTSGPILETINMIQSGDDVNLYRSERKLSRQITGKEILYKYVLDESGTLYESPQYSYVVAGPDLFLTDIKLSTTSHNLALQVKCKNIGNAPSTNTDLRLYITPEGQPTYLYKSQQLAGIGVNEQRWETIEIDTLLSANVSFEVRANWSNTFPEWHFFYNTNNSITLAMPFNYQLVGSSETEFSSIDNNVICKVPANLLATNQNAYFYIHNLVTPTPLDQPDISAVMLASGANTKSYEIQTMDSTLTDSTGVFVNGKALELTFKYHPTDAQTQQYETENSYGIFRWDSTYQKWILQGGNISTSTDRVVFSVNRTGTYSLFRNKDSIRPSIDLNVQDQEFTVGGYVSGKGTLSLILSDANGINVNDGFVNMFISDGVSINEIDKRDFVMTLNSANTNRIPLKYQLDLPRGTYTLKVDCSDVNGKTNSREFQFNVNDKFDVINVANYPNPVVGRGQDPKNDGRTRFTYVLTDDADEITIKVYTVSGRLVKTFKNLPAGVGYHEYPRTVYSWDCKDEHGYLLANGVYFYRIIAKKGSKTIEKTQKMAILK